MSRRILTVVGARPQFIKAAPVSRAIRSHEGLEEVLVHTGQHYDAGMSKVFFDELEMPAPKHDLGVGSGSHAEQTGEIMKRLERVLLEEKPGMVLIYGDTNSTLAGALTAAKLHIPVAHVEAGLRSFNRRMPEEINRIVADTLSALLFAPTAAAVENLRREGITEGIHKTGDVMYDAALMFGEKARSSSTALKRLGLRTKGYVLATVHRAENTDCRERLASIASALAELTRETPLVLPLHPRTAKMLREFGLDGRLEGVTVIEPAGFLDMIQLERNACVIVTDSGGVQKEAYFHRVPCVTLRDETEWVETVAAGWNRLVAPASPGAVATAIRKALQRPPVQGEISEYGVGDAARKVAQAVAEF